MAEHPCMPFWTDAYLGDTLHLTTLEHGAYLLLLFTAWRSKEGTLPDDDKLLSRYTKLSLDKWRKIRPVLEGFFSIENGIWSQGRLLDERKANLDFRKSQSQKGKARHLKNKETTPAPAQPSVSPASAYPKPIPKVEESKQESFLETPREKPTETNNDNPPWYEGKLIKLNRKDFEKWLAVYGGTYDQFFDYLNDRDKWLFAQSPEKRKNWFMSTKKHIESLKESP